MAFLAGLKRLLIGAPIASSRAHHEKLPVVFGLPVFASDAISSVAYATEEILLVLALVGSTAYLGNVIYVALAIAILVCIVVFSYVRTIYAYPQGGGGYRVASDNLGSKPGRVAGAALLLGYVLTVAVSVSSGILAIVSAFPTLQPYIVDLGLVAILIMALLNLRGAKESGVVFAIPTYGFIICIFIMIIAGRLSKAEVTTTELTAVAGNSAGLWLLVRAFAAGCTALTGIEAIADGAGAFRAPEARNASVTLILLACILMCLFLGVSWLATHFGVVPMKSTEPGYMTVLAQIAQHAFGNGPMFYAIQIATMAILILGANTAYADFPRLCSFIAKDSYMPRQLANLGDRLVFQNGIILLSVCGGLLIFFFQGDTHRLLPLYAVGVLVSFTLSQAGMVVRQIRMNLPTWGVVASAVGCFTTGAVGVIILCTKFFEGAWLITISCAVLLTLFFLIRRHYDSLARQLTVSADEGVPHMDSTVLLLLPPRIHRGILQAVAYARTLSQDCRAVTVTIDPSSTGDFKRDWEAMAPDIPLIILESPYRSLVEPLLEYIDDGIGEDPNRMLTVIVPQAVPKHWYQGLLHNNAALPLKLALGSRKNVVITNVRYFLSE